MIFTSGRVNGVIKLATRPEPPTRLAASGGQRTED